MQEPVNPDLITLREVAETNTLNISRLEGVVSQLEKWIDNLEHEVRELRVELVGRTDHFYTELSVRVDRLNRELSERIDRSEEPINKRLDRLGTELNDRIGGIEVELSRRSDRLEDRMNKMSDSIGNIYRRIDWG